MKKNDCLSSEKLILYSDGSLSKEELKEVEEHLKNCSSCKEEVEYLQGVFTKIEVASVCPSVDELIEYNPEGDGSRDIFIKSHVKFCSKCQDVLNKLSSATELFDEPPKDIKTTKLPEKVLKEIERYYPEQKKMSFWQFLSSFFFSKKNMAVFSSIFVIICCLLIFKLTFVPQMFGKSNMASINEKIEKESKLNSKEDGKEIDSAIDDVVNEIMAEVEAEDEENAEKKSEKVEDKKIEDKNQELANIEEKTDENKTDIKNNDSNKNSNSMTAEFLNKDNDNFIDNEILSKQNNRNTTFDYNNNEDNLEESLPQESEEMGQLRREYMQGAEVEIHELENKKNVSVPKSEPSKPVEKPVKRYVIPIKPVDSVEHKTIQLNSNSLSKDSSSEIVSQKNDYRKDTNSNNEVYNQLRKKLIKNREEAKEQEEPPKAQSDLTAKVPVNPTVTPKEETSQKQPTEKKHKVTKEQILEELHKQRRQEESNISKAPTHKKRFVRQQSQPVKVSTPVNVTSVPKVPVPKAPIQVGNTPAQTQSVVGRAVDMKSNSSSGMVVPSNNETALSKSIRSNESSLSISPLALEYRINTEIGYGSVTITSVNEGGSIYYEIKQNRALTGEDLAVINSICSEYRDIKIRFK